MPSVKAVGHRLPAHGSTAGGPSDVAAGADESAAAWIRAMLQAAWLVDAGTLRIVAANAAAGILCGVADDRLIGAAVLDFLTGPEDLAFWLDAKSLGSESLDSEAFLRRSGDELVPVVRRASRLNLPGRTAGMLYLVVLEDRSPQRRRDGELEEAVASLQSTLDSLTDGILVTDLRGRIRNFNRRFAELWALPKELLLQRHDDAVLDWMRSRVSDPSAYMRRLAAIDDATLLRAQDAVMLRSGQVLERITLPQCCRGQLAGRVYTFRELPGRPAEAKRPH